MSLKAYCGFKGHGNNEPDIATGKWGCGAFNGDPQLKGKPFHRQPATDLSLKNKREDLSFSFVCMFSCDPADGSSKGKERVGLLHLWGWQTEARPGADLPPAARRGGYSRWEFSAQKTVQLLQVVSHLGVLIFQIAPPQRNCTNFWMTSVVFSTHPAVHMWICLSSSGTA